jgi:hypothetical protein
MIELAFILASLLAQSAPGRIVVFDQSPSVSGGTKCLAYLIQPEPMDIARKRLHSTSQLPLGLWRIVLHNSCPQNISIPKEQIEIQAPDVRFLSKEIALPILIDIAGGKWKQAAHYLMLAAAAAPGFVSATTISSRAVKMVAAGMTAIEILRKDLDAKTPDISALMIEIPATVTIPSNGGVTLNVWAAKMKNARTLKGEM